MQKSSDTEPAFFSKAEMLECARKERFHVTESLFDDWVEKGLIGRPTVKIWPGQGHGSGSIAKWSQPQRNLFLGLLLHHQRYHLRSIRALCNLPVWGWLYYSDVTVISLEQIKQVMTTWAKGYFKFSLEKVRKSARQTVALAASPQAPTIKNRVTEKLAKIGLGEDMPDEELLYLLRELTDPKQLGEAKGPTGAALSADVIYSLITARFKATTQLSEIPDALWYWARTALLITYAHYREKQPHYASDPTIDANLRNLYPRENLQTSAASACQELLVVLGITLQYPELLGWPEHLQPRAWLAGQATSTIRTQVTASPVLLPTGIPAIHQRIEVVVSYQGHYWTYVSTLPQW